MPSVDIGQQAPNLTLVSMDRKPVSLAEFKGKNVVLAFFPGAFTGVCIKEMCAFRDSMSSFNSMNAQVVAVSVDSPFAQKGFADANKLTFPILSDYNREAVKTYSIELHDFAGLKGYTAAKRSVFVLDKSGVVRYKWVSDVPTVEPNYAEINAALQKLK